MAGELSAGELSAGELTPGGIVGRGVVKEPSRNPLQSSLARIQGSLGTKYNFSGPFFVVCTFPLSLDPMSLNNFLYWLQKLCETARPGGQGVRRAIIVGRFHRFWLSSARTHTLYEHLSFIRSHTTSPGVEQP